LSFLKIIPFLTGKFNYTENLEFYGKNLRNDSINSTKIKQTGFAVPYGPPYKSG